MFFWDTVYKKNSLPTTKPSKVIISAAKILCSTAHLISVVLKRSIFVLCTVVQILDATLLEWLSEYAVRAYTTPDNGVSFLNHAQMAQTPVRRLL